MNDSRRSLWAIGWFRVSRSLAAGMIMLGFPYLILRTLHYGAWTLGLLYAVAGIGTAALGLGFGFLADVWGRKPTMILVGVLLPVSAGCVLLSLRLAHPLPGLYAASILGGFSATGSLMGGGVGGAAQPIQSAVVADLTHLEKRTFYFSLFTFISGIFAALGALLGRLFSVPDMFLAAMIIASVGLLALLPLRLPRYRPNPRKLASRKVIGKFSLTGALNGFTQGLITPFLIPFFVLVFHVARPQMAIYGFISGSLGSLALLAAPLLERCFGFVHSIAVTRGLGAMLLIILPFEHWLPLALGIYFLTPALRVMALPVQQTALSERVNADELGRALGLNQVARLAASSGAIAFTGYMFDSALEVPFFLYGAIMVLNIYLYYRFFRQPGAPAPEAGDTAIQA